MNVATPSIAFISHQVRGGNLVAKENCSIAFGGKRRLLDSRKVNQHRRQDERDYYDRHVVALLDLRPPREPRERVRLHSSTLRLRRLMREFRWRFRGRDITIISTAQEDTSDEPDRRSSSFTLTRSSRAIPTPDSSASPCSRITSPSAHGHVGGSRRRRGRVAGVRRSRLREARTRLDARAEERARRARGSGRLGSDEGSSAGRDGRCAGTGRRAHRFDRRFPKLDISSATDFPCRPT